jgi:hypothetical protein
MDWNIKPRSETCQVTGRPFQEGEVFHTALFQGPEELERMDYSVEAWERRDPEPTPLSSWQSIFKPTPLEEEQTVDPSDAESVLRHLLGKQEPSHGKTCLLLALLLERKRVLKLREKIQSESGNSLVYEHVESQESILVPDMDFQLSELAELVQQLEESRDIEVFGRQSPSPSEGS